MNALTPVLTSLLNRIASRWGTSALGVVIAALLVWYLGPLVPGLAAPLLRAAMVLALVLGWAGVNAALTWRRRRRERALAAGVADAGDEADAAAEVAQLRERMQEAVGRLRAGGARGALYEQPWYVLIGPPGSGKTTALLNAGLHFPLSESDGSDPRIGGVGGTRLCDWWFADEAVLIDTAGRYTTQDSDAAVDRAGWHGFLDLLRRTRPRQPLNGVIVVVPLAEIAAADPAERAAHARAIRRRVNEIADRLRLRVPVYMVFSKVDQLTGYAEYFDDLDAEGRAQVWGMTFPLARGVELFADEFRLLLERLERRLFGRLQAERAPDRRALLAGFPLQLASVGPPVQEFLGAAFGGTRLDPAPLLRGVYLTSATQEGTPIDRLTGLLSRAFGVDQRRVPALRPTAGRAYFLKRLVADVIFGEALLVSATPRDRRRRLAWRAAGFSAVGLATLAGVLLLGYAERTNQAAIEQAGAALGAYRARLDGLPLDTFTEDDLPRTAKLLDAAEALPHRPALALAGLDQDRKLGESERHAYRAALERIFLPRLVWRVETQMRGRLRDSDFLYGATRVDLMLGGSGPLDPGIVRGWEVLDWANRFPGVLNGELRERLAHHLDALLAEPLPPVALDQALLGAARASFSRVSLAQRIYGRLRLDAASGPALPDWTPASALGPAGLPLFTRLSGKPLTEGIPALYTAAGARPMLAALPATARAVAGESWVLGTAADDAAAKDPASLERAVLALYAADTEAHWDALLDDLALATPSGREAVVQGLYILASPQSPMRDLLVAIVRQLDFAPPSTGDKPGGQHAPAANSAPAAGDAAAVAAELDQHYAALRGLVGQGDSQATTAPLAGVLGVVNTLQGEVARSGPGAASAPAVFQGGGDPVQLLLAEAQRQPAPVARWLRQIAVSGQGALNGNAKAAAGSAYEGAEGPGALCHAVVDGHYPFEPGAASDAPFDGVARLFAPNGALDAYFKAQLAPYVDTKGRTWRAAPLAGVASPTDAATIAAFQRAAAIRDALFADGGSTPSLRFTVAPARAGQDAKLVLGGTTVGGDADAPRPMLWPGADGTLTASVTGAKDAPVAQASGPWALFRLLDKARVSGSGDTLTLAFATAGQDASFVLRTEAASNPFRAKLLQGFRCPAVR